MPDDVAFFIAERFKSNIRELEGALKRVVAHARFTGQQITQEFARQALKELLAVQDKPITIDNIQKLEIPRILEQLKHDLPHQHVQ